MPTVVDELVVKLGLDPKDFVSGQKKATDALRKTKEAAKEGSKEVSEGAGDMLKAFGGLQGKLLGIAALFTGGLGLTEFSKKMAAATTQTTYLARQVGVSAQALETWEGAGAKVGATAGEIAGSIANMNKQLLAGQLHGVTGIQKFFRAMNVNPYDRNGKRREMTDVLMDMSRWGKTQKPEMAAQIFSEMGNSPGMINLLLQGPEKLKAALDENKKAALPDGDRKKFEDLNTSFHQLTLDTERLARSIEIHLLPTIQKTINFLDRLAKFLTPASPEKVKEFTDKKLPEMGGSKSIFGRIKDWWNGSSTTGDSSKSETGSSAVTATTSAAPPRPSAGGNDVAPTMARARAAAAKGYMIDQLRREGVPEGNVEAAASMLAGQAIAESNLRPNLIHDGGTGYGIYGARLDRRSRMLAWLKENGYAANSLEGQSRYMAREAMNDPRFRASRAALVAATRDNMASGTRILTRNFEAPAVDNSPYRLGAALGVLGIPADVWARGSTAIIPHPGLMALQGAGNVSHNNTTSTTSVQNLNVYSPTNDPYGHAADIAASLQRTSAMNQANQGPN